MRRILIALALLVLLPVVADAGPVRNFVARVRAHRAERLGCDSSAQCAPAAQATPCQQQTVTVTPTATPAPACVNGQCPVPAKK